MVVIRITLKDGVPLILNLASIVCLLPKNREALTSNGILYRIADQDWERLEKAALRHLGEEE